MSDVEITPKAVEAPMLGFNIVGIGKFQLPYLGAPGVPLGINSAVALFSESQHRGDAQKLSAWAHLFQALSDSYPDAFRILAKLGEDDVLTVFESWVKRSEEFDPNRVSSPV